MKKHLLSLVTILACSVGLQAQYTTSKSYTLSQTAKSAGFKSTGTLSAASHTDVSRSIQYYDRLGRPLQSIDIKATPGLKDIVSFQQYNSLGQATKSYLPYVSTANDGLYRSSALTEQGSFYNPAGNVNYGKSTAPWAEVAIEASPMKRTLEQGGVGSLYQLSTGRTTKYDYGLNTTADQVLLWEITATGGLKLSESTYYAADKLDVVTVKGPEWQVADGNVGTSKTFTDYLGRTILSRTYNNTETYDTYYVYDDLGNVRYVIPPEAVRETLGGNADQINDNQIFHTSQVFPSGYAKNTAYYYMPGVEVTLDPTMEFTPGFSLEQYPIDENFLYSWLYINEYDDRNQLVSKKVPGAEPVHYVYDRAGRLILSQDGNQRLTNQWTFTKYDRFDRPVLTGTVTDARDKDALVSYIYYEITTIYNHWYEERGSAVHGYTNRVFPYVSNENDYLVVSYYDDYDFKSNWGSVYDYATNPINSSNYETRPLGQETGGKIRVIDPDPDPNEPVIWLKSVKYYDEDGQLIESVADHHMNNIERFFAAYNFVGNMTQSRMEHVINASKTVSLSDRFQYDHAGRLEKQWHSVDDEPEVLMAVNSYNELGEAIETNLHSTDDGLNFIQSIDSRYDVQGRLTHINNAQRNNDGTYNNDGTDQFGMELFYDTSLSGLGITPQYNGGLAGVTWSNGTMTGVDQRGFGYSYDRSNRLTAANYKEKVGSNWNTKVGHYDVNISDYDYNGNIEHLVRKQSIGGSAVMIDDLVYSYNGNQLKAVNDQTNHEKGFKDGAELTTEYTYDANGNMITDSNKLITGISYNQLNRPEVITFSSGDKITYTYDASGTRIKQEITVSSTVSQTYDYVGGMIFDNGTLAEISTGPGRLKVDVFGNDYNYDYQYFLTDHLGNTRTMIAPLERKYVAGMETARADQEEAQFLYVNETRYSGQAYTGSNASMLNAAASIPKVLGPAKAIKVYNGDQVDMSVWAKYTDTNGASETSAVNKLMPALIAAFGVNGSSTGEALSVFDALDAQFGASAYTLFNQNPGDIPEANLNYLFFDSNYVFQYGGAVQVNSTNYTKLTNSFTANKDGILFIYLANESTLNANVYFDDLVITHTSANAVLQADDYYPFGLPMDNNGFLEAGISPNRFLYQGKEWQTQLGLNLYDFHARQFDPALGRFLSADAASQFVSPYVGMGNVPTLSVDPDGNFAFLLPLLTTVLPTFTVTAWSTATTLAVIGGSALVAGGATAAILSSGATAGSFGAGGAGLLGGGCPPVCDGTRLAGSGAEFEGQTLRGGISNNGVNNQIYRPRSPIQVEPLAPRPYVSSFAPPGVQPPSLSPLSVGNPASSLAGAGSTSVGQPGFWEGIIPVWGSARSAVDHFQNGNIGRGLLQTGLAVTDLFLVKSAVTAVGKLGASVFGGFARSSGSNLWRVGRYNQLSGLESGLNAHHVGQKALMKNFIPNYNWRTAPSILVPEIGHITRGPLGRISTSMKGFTNARQVLARDIWELRRVYPNIPTSSLHELIQLNKKFYPSSFLK